MIPALVSLKSLIKTKSYHIDYPIFRLHYQATVCALLAFCLILTAKILFGDTIDCKSRILGRDDYYDNICFSRGTYTMYAIDHENLKLASQLQEIPNLKDTTAQSSNENQGQLNNSHGVMEKLVASTKEEQQEGFFAGLGNWVMSTMNNWISDLEDDADIHPSVQHDISREENTTTLPDRNITNHTYVRVTFPDQALANTELGEYLKEQFRVIHRLIKNRNKAYSTRIEYIHSGIMVPRETKELYSMTFMHSYYQYITIILFLQAVFFYLPHYLWKIWESGIVSSICKMLHENRISPSEYIDSNYHMIDYLQNAFTLNKSLVYKYYFCHVLLLINLILQIIVLNSVFNNQFVTYGIDVFTYLFIDWDVYGLRKWNGRSQELNNPMDFVFPKVTSCSFETLSQAGMKPNNYNFLCILPLNILHDKFFLVLWFWFLILAILTTLQLIFDGVYIAIPKLRKHLFKRRFGPYLSDANRHSSSLSELFLLDLIGTNSDRFAFAALLRKLNKEDLQSCPVENQSLV